MNNKLFFLLFLFCTSSLLAGMMPVVIDGRYYYPYEDVNYVHLNFSKTVLFLQKRIFSSVKNIEKQSSSPSQESVLDVHGILQPTQSIPQPYSQEPVITWIGHATFLIQMRGINILTDPVFGDVKAGLMRVSKRTMPPGIELENLPVIHAIVLSHNHHDHTDPQSLKMIAKKYNPVVYVPLGNRELIEGMGFTKVIEHNWWDDSILNINHQLITITCLPAYHWSMRSFWGFEAYRKSLWSSWMIGGEYYTIYFAGDTAYGPHFKEIAEKFPVINTALMPIAPTQKGASKHKEAHVDALEAVDAFIDLQAHCFIPMHYGTFFLGEDTLIYPLQRLPQYWDQCKDLLQGKELLIAQCGKEYAL